MDKQDLRTVVVSALTAVAVSVIFEVGSGVISFLRSGWSESAASQPSEQQRRRARAMRPPDMMEYHSRMGGGWREYYDSPELQAKEQERQKLLLEIATLAGESVQFGNVTLKEVWEKRKSAIQPMLRQFRREIGDSGRDSISEASINLYAAQMVLMDRKLQYQAGALPLDKVLEAELEVNQVEQELLIYPEAVRRNIGFLDAFEQWKKAPIDPAALRRLVEAEQEARSAYTY